ncbi:MAG: hypothetical protein QGG72_01825 [Verrucomicrobiota bacterium]|jgi:hypothetical protein|nr:hypothetical protein [Verrucomicrobiota bacterium]|tara:strand:- start:266 stop:391 length:126 start_codon:yes stop_codon:yes gene_type:complete
MTYTFSQREKVAEGRMRENGELFFETPRLGQALSLSRALSR